MAGRTVFIRRPFSLAVYYLTPRYPLSVLNSVKKLEGVFLGWERTKMREGNSR